MGKPHQPDDGDILSDNNVHCRYYDTQSIVENYLPRLNARPRARLMLSLLLLLALSAVVNSSGDDSQPGSVAKKRRARRGRRMSEGESRGTAALRPQWGLRGSLQNQANMILVD
jgi:hypothetical protein